MTEFYLPCLSASVQYDRAVGYFTSGGLAAAARGIAALIKNGGRMRLVASPMLSEHDYNEIQAGYQKRAEEIIETRVIEVLDSIPHELVEEKVGSLAWLVSVGRLDIKLAYSQAGPDPGIYHEKTGIFYDSADNIVAFSGSPNETRGGLISNFENIDVFTSWSGTRDEKRVRVKVSDFEQLWMNRTRGLTVIPFPDAARRKLIALRPNSEPTFNFGSSVGAVFIPKKPLIEMRAYQEAAIEAWRKNELKGILSMATGTGKTLTSLKAIEPLLDKGWLIIITVPSLLLLEQWGSIIEWAYPNSLIVKCSGRHSSWRKHVFDAVNAKKLMSGKAVTPNRPLFIIATLGTAHKIDFKSIVFDNWGLSHLCLIVDEVHQSGSRMHSHLLDLKAEARLGLSATPKRDWDPIGWKKILDFFDSIVYDYPLSQAIREGWLSEYDYYVHFVYLAEDELDQYRKLSKSMQKKLAELLSRNPSFASIPSLLRFIELHGSDREQDLCGAVERLMMNRAKVLKLAKSKAVKTMDILDSEKFESCIVYCHDRNQLDEIAGLADTAGCSIGIYHSGLSQETRRTILHHFKMGHTKILIAIRCLDEGVDIPKTEGAILVASDRSRRQFVQRRGRLLRPYEDKIARIHDVFVMPISDWGAQDNNLSEIERSILECELSRAAIFAQDARNRSEVEQVLSSIQSRLELDLSSLETH